MSIFEAVGAVAKNGLSLKPNHHNQVKLVQIRDKFCRHMQLKPEFATQSFNYNLCNGSERLVLKEGDGDEGAVDDDGHDEDEDKTDLE